MQAEAVVLGRWMTQDQSLHSLALSSVIPAPMVTFSSFVGFVRGEQLAIQHHILPTVAAEMIGAVLCSVGMFLPAFTITIAGHHVLEPVVHNAKVSALWDGITASVVGLVAITALQSVKTGLRC